MPNRESKRIEYKPCIYGIWEPAYSETRHPQKPRVTSYKKMSDEDIIAQNKANEGVTCFCAQCRRITKNRRRDWSAQEDERVAKLDEARLSWRSEQVKSKFEGYRKRRLSEQAEDGVVTAAHHSASLK